MKGISSKAGLLAVAMTACSATAQAQTQCDQQIRQLEQEIQQQPIDQQLQTEVEQLLQAAEQNPGDCNTYLARAQEVLNQRAGVQVTQGSQAAGQQQQSQQQSTGVDKASQLMGQTVKDQQGQELGSLEDFALDMEQGKLAYVVISAGGMFDDKKVGVPADQLRAAPEGDGFVASFSSQEIESAQSLPSDQWPAQPTLGGQSGGGGTAEPASELVGMSVKDSQGNSLGSIEDFAIDMQQGKLAYVVLGAGGSLLGMGDQKLIGVPTAALQQGQDGYVASISKQEIEQAPDLPEDNWPQQPTIASASQPQGAGGVQQSTQIQGQTVTNSQGEILGQIEEFALDMQQGKLAYVAIRTNEGKQVGIPADMLRPAQQGEGYVADISRQQLQNAQELPQQNWPEQPSIAQSGSQPGSGSQSSPQTMEFSSLDQNQDGYISQQEAQQGDQQVSQNFQQIDQNADQQIDRTEFAAFEQQNQ